MERMRPWLLLLLRWAVGAGIVVVLLAKIDVANVGASLAAARPAYLAAALVTGIAFRLLSACQLTLALRHLDVPVTVGRAFVVNAIANFYGLFVPGQLAAGVVKWYKLARDSGRGAETFATILFLRILNTTFVFLFGVLAVIVDDRLGVRGIPLLVLAFLAGLGALLFMMSDRGWTRWVERRLRRGAALAPARLQSGLDKVFSALREYRTLPTRQAAALLAMPVLGQLIAGVFFLLVARALDLALPPVTLIWLVSLVYFVHLVPASISGLGLREGALVFLLPKYGVSAADALAFSLLVFALNVVLDLVGGIFEARETLWPHPVDAVDAGKLE